ncbi:Pyruvate kinase [Frankliniella fusca]|uniref:Pyruvate kinase n=1 Tax=Frankliniella fusca TaxID=407009 RepID=A0AAE1LRJ0_9NEOP|nr:Pyruvate kinase [Frankliniella fusca]KAK3927727.1 Pyruvate kinase [Frankliniella fusca]
MEQETPNTQRKQRLTAKHRANCSLISPKSRLNSDSISPEGTEQSRKTRGFHNK